MLREQYLIRIDTYTAVVRIIGTRSTRCGKIVCKNGSMVVSKAHPIV